MTSNAILPDDLFVQILARLPIKSLFRCKSVCKFWCGLPSDRHFVHLYNQLSSRNPMVIVERIGSILTQPTYVCVDRNGGLSEFSMDFLRDRVKIRASCNGLLCCASVGNHGVYYVCNPMTREFKLLPRTRQRNVSRYRPNYEATLVGLAYLPSNGKFYVALAGFYRLFGHRPLDQLVCFIYDSVTNAWSRFVSSYYDEFTHMNRNQVVFASGSLHWLTHCCSYLLVLDLEGKFWRKISLPDGIVAGGTGSRISLLELEGSVSVVRIMGTWMCIWVLKDYMTEEWTVVDQVHLRCILGLVPNVFPITQNGESIFLATQNKILIYRRKDKVWKEIFAVKDNFTYPLWFTAHAFRGTLFSCNLVQELV